ncbi:MAG: lyase domain protein repeat-containing protein [Myxococcales bacterium]|nr:lyase domain protein repeat-containing protein [Myxococcales bacterium]
MNTMCPTCNKPVDPLRARSVGVRDGKVVAYCSTECARAAETKPTVVPKRTPATGVVAAAAPFALDSGPVIEIVREPASAAIAEAHDEPKVGVDLGKMRELDRQHGRASTPDQVAPGSKALKVIVLVLVLVGAGAYLAHRFLLSNRDGSASATTPTAEQVPVVVPVAADAATAEVVVDRDASVAKARAVLTQNLDSDSPRVQRVAAAALARTGDARALESLATALAKETSDVGRLELAYALARVGDKRGMDALVAAIGSARRDVKLEAGRMLARLGDARAVPPLASYLAVSQLRLGASEQLAYLAEPRAITALTQIRDDAKSSTDDKARATIALGIAGKTEVIPALQELLKDGRFNTFAAAALSELHDPSAKSLLLEQLSIPSLRVQAARSLRRLEPALDPSAQLTPLLAALDSKKDTELIQISESILLLAGPVSWSERP